MDFMKQFMQSVGLLLILTVWGMISSPIPYACMILAGLLMILFAMDSLSEEQNIFLQIGIFILSMTFSVQATGFFPFLIFSEIRIGKIEKVRWMLPAFLFLGTSLIAQKRSLPEMIFQTLILLAIAGVLYWIEEMIAKYLRIQEQIAQAVSMTAMNELYEKKLNQELVMKNYLADKNARLEERETISRNIHNSVGHSITAAIMTLDAADMLFDTSPEKAREKMNLANERIHVSLESIRHAVRVMDTENVMIEMHDFVQELAEVADSFAMDTMIHIRTDFTQVDERLLIPREYTEFLTGALQELLSNGVRHGKAERFRISLLADSIHMKLCVSDNGMSDFSEGNQQERIRQGFGLKKMISYVEKCGGTIQFRNKNGFHTEIGLKIYREAEDE